MLGLLVAGCSAKSSRFISPDEVSDHLIKQSPADLQRAMGQPRSIEQTGPNEWKWTYHSDMIRNKKPTQGKCELIITFEGQKAIKAVVNSSEYSPVVGPLATCNLMVDKL